MSSPVPFAEIYRRHRRQALAIARRILNDADEAEDIVQEVFIRLHQRPDLFAGRSAYSTWLFRVMVNRSINRLRANRRRATLSTEGESPLTPEQLVTGRELMGLFERALLELSERHREILTLRELRGMAYPEIAQLLRIPEGTVKSSLNRGRAQVQRFLDAAA